MKTMMKSLAAVSVLALAMTACQKDDINGTDTGAPAAGRTMYIDMTDAPANFARMDIEISGVEVYHDTRGWIVLSSQTKFVNVLSLANGVSTTIASGSALESGHYSKVRVHFGENNSVKLNAGVTLGHNTFAAGSTAKLSWGMSERYVDVSVDANISSEKGARVLLDFNAEESVREGLTAFVFTPSLTQMTNSNTGVRGKAENGNHAAFIVLANREGSYSAYSQIDGTFLVRGMQPGTYHATIKMMKRNPTTGVYEERTVERDDITVREGGYTNMGSIGF